MDLGKCDEFDVRGLGDEVLNGGAIRRGELLSLSLTQQAHLIAQLEVLRAQCFLEVPRCFLNDRVDAMHELLGLFAIKEP